MGTDLRLYLRRIFRHGLQDFTGDRVGESELILDGSATTVDISAFRPTRFAESMPIKAEFECKDD